MTLSELEYLLTDEAQRLIGRHLDGNPSVLALKGIPAPVCTQIKYLQRCRNKLPDFYEAQCIIPPLSFEQSSSSAAASSRCFKGVHCVDMTCGLGMDALHFSRYFDKVTAIERDEILYRIACHNFMRLGVGNIEVIHGDSAEVVGELKKKQPADLVYVDPARRKEGKKVFLFSDCSPDITSLMPSLVEWSDLVVIKASPLFDIDEAFALFSGYGKIGVEVISCNNECKELILALGRKIEKNTITNVLVAGTGEIKRFVFDTASTDGNSSDARFPFLGFPDVAFYKSRTLDRLVSGYYPDAVATGRQGILLLPVPPVGFPGKVFRIIARFAYKPKEIARYLSEKGIKKGTVLKHDFRFTVERVRKDLKIGDGDDIKLFCTDIFEKPVVFVIEDYGI